MARMSKFQRRLVACVYINILICIHTYIYICFYVYTWVCLYEYILCMRVCVAGHHTYEPKFSGIVMYLCMYIYAYMYIYMYLRVNICMRMLCMCVRVSDPHTRKQISEWTVDV